MIELDRFSSFGNSQSDGNLVAFRVASDNQRDLLASPSVKEKRKKGRRRRKKDEGERKSKHKRRKGKKSGNKRSSSAAMSTTRKSNYDAALALSLPARGKKKATGRRAQTSREPEEKEEAPSCMKQFDQRFGADLGRKMIENAGKRALASSTFAASPFIIDENGVKRGLQEISGTTRYFMVVERVGDAGSQPECGAHGVVFKGWDSFLERFVAIKRQKLLKASLPEDFESRSEPERGVLAAKHAEFSASSMLPFRELALMRYVGECVPHVEEKNADHARAMKEGKLAVIPLYDSFFNPNTDAHYIITPYSEFGDMFHMFKHKESICKQANKEYKDIVRELFADMVCAVHYLHTIGVCHGDIKLENFILFWDAYRGRFCVRLCDFGLSYMALPDKLSVSTSMTVLYASPELIDAAIAEAVYNQSIDACRKDEKGGYAMSTPFMAKNIGPRAMLASDMLDIPNFAYPAVTTDVWALAVCLFCLVFECHPFEPFTIPGEGKISTITHIRRIRQRQSVFFSSSRFDYDPCREFGKATGPMELINAVFQDAWSVRPRTLEILQNFPWVRGAIVKEEKKEKLDASSSSSGSFVSESPPRCDMSPFAQAIRRGCGTEIALQYDGVLCLKPRKNTTRERDD